MGSIGFYLSMTEVLANPSGRAQCRGRDASRYFPNTRVWNRFLACSTIVYLRVRSCQTSSTSKLIFPGTDFSHALLKSTYVYVVVRLLVPNKIIFAGTDFSHALV